ncbi:hypothetical protein Tco_1400549 [Tanacetum coccineum]
MMIRAVDIFLAALEVAMFVARNVLHLSPFLIFRWTKSKNRTRRSFWTRFVRPLQLVFPEMSPSEMVLHQLTSECSHHSLYPDNTVEYVVAMMQSLLGLHVEEFSSKIQKVSNSPEIYTPVSPDYSPASDTEFDPSEDPSSDHIPPLPATSPFLLPTDDSSNSDIPDTPITTLPLVDPFSRDYSFLLRGSPTRILCTSTSESVRFCSVQPIPPWIDPYCYHLNGPVHMMTMRKRVGLLPTHRLAVRHSVDYSSSDHFSSDDSSRRFIIESHPESLRILCRMLYLISAITMPNTLSGASRTREGVNEQSDTSGRRKHWRRARACPETLRPLTGRMEGEQEVNRNGYNGNRGNRAERRNKGNRIIMPVEKCTCQDFQSATNLTLMKKERDYRVVGLTRWFEKMETVFHISNCPEKYQVKYAFDCTWI